MAVFDWIGVKICADVLIFWHAAPYSPGRKIGERLV
jgi:hypothetical protein